MARKEPLRLGTTKPLDLSRINLTRLNSLFGSRVSDSLEKGLSQFGRAFPYLLQRDAIIEGIILLRGVEGPKAEQLAPKGIFVPNFAATDCLDFSFVASASFRAAIALCTHGRKAS